MIEQLASDSQVLGFKMGKLRRRLSNVRADRGRRHRYRRQVGYWRIRLPGLGRTRVG